MIDVERRVELGKLVGEHVSFLLNECKTDEETTYLKMRIADSVKVVKVIDIEEMSDVQAKEFEKQIMPFGAKKGLLIADIETDYLCLVTDTSPFWSKLRLYTKWRVKHDNQDR